MAATSLRPLGTPPGSRGGGLPALSAAAAAPRSPQLSPLPPPGDQQVRRLSNATVLAGQGRSRRTSSLRPPSAPGGRGNTGQLPIQPAAPEVVVNAPLVLPPARVQSFVAVFDDALEQLAVLADIADAAQSADRISLLERRLKLSSSAGTGDGGRQSPHARTLKSSGNGLSLSSSMSAGAGGIQNSSSAVKMARERAALQNLLIRASNELQVGAVDALCNAVEEETRKKNTLQITIDREREAGALLADLQRQLREEQRLLEEDKRERDNVIQQLKDAIQEINTLTASEQKYIKKETKAHEVSIRLRCRQDEVQLHVDRARLEKEIELEVKAHREIVDLLTRQREHLEREIQVWMDRYEVDTERKAAELEQLKTNRSNDIDRIEELEAKYEELDRLIEEDKVLKAKAAEDRKQRRAQERRERSATKIQRWWRQMLVKLKGAGAVRKGTAGRSGSGRKSGSANKKKTASAAGSAAPKKKSAK
ncbi:hypothetical protein RI367_007345 [Sorochytrium milnesiophthora]